MPALRVQIPQVLQAAMSAELLRFRMRTIRDVDKDSSTLADDDNAYLFSSDSDDTVNYIDWRDIRGI